MDRYSSLSRTNIERRPEILGFGLLALAATLVANSVLGPLLFDVIDYPVSTTMRNQTIGLDAANLAVVAPACAVVGWLALRGNRWAPLLALGPTTYAAYMFIQYIAGPDHAKYVAVLPLQLVGFVLGWAMAGFAWSARPSFGRPHVRRAAHTVVVGLLASFVVLRYSSGLVATFTEEPLPSELRADLAMYWLIFLMDLGVFVPVAVAVMVGLWRGSEWAMPALAGLVAWYLLVTVAVGGMSIVMVVNDDQYASSGQLGLFAAMTLALLAYALVVFQALRSETRADSQWNRS